MYLLTVEVKDRTVKDIGLKKIKKIKIKKAVKHLTQLQRIIVIS